MSAELTPEQLQQVQAQVAQVLNTPEYQNSIEAAFRDSTSTGSFDSVKFGQDLLRTFGGSTDLAGIAFQLLTENSFAKLQEITSAVEARRRAAGLATPGATPLSASASTQRVATAKSAGKSGQYDFWLSRRITRPGTVRAGTVSGASKKTRQELYKNDLARLHELGINDFKKKLGEKIQFDHAILRWGQTFARHGVDRKEGKLTVNYTISKDKLDASGRPEKDKNGKTKKVDVPGGTFTLSYEEFLQFVAHNDHATRSIEDWLKSRRSHGGARANPHDYEFKLQNAIIYVNNAFRTWWANEVFGSIDAEFRQGLARAAMGLDPSVNHDLGAPTGTVVDAGGDAAYKAVMAKLGLPSGSTLLSQGFTTVAATSLIRIAIKSARGVIVDEQGNISFTGETEGLAGVLAQYFARTTNQPADSLKKVLSCSSAMLSTFARMTASRQYGPSKTKSGASIKGKHVTVSQDRSNPKTTFQALGELYDARLFPEEAAAFQAKVEKAAKKGRSLFVPSPNLFYSSNIGSLLYLNGDLISSFTDGTAEASAKVAELQGLAASGDKSAALMIELIQDRVAKVGPESSDLLRVLLRESRYIRMFYSTHWRKEKDIPGTVTQIYNTLVASHAFPEILQQYGLSAEDIVE